MAGRPQRYEIATALDPYDATGINRRTVWVSQARVDWMLKGGLGPRFYRMRLIEQAVSDPDWVFEGLRDGQEYAVCYVGRPERDFPGDGLDLPAPPGMVFAVYVNSTGEIRDWGWEPCDVDDPRQIEGSVVRFARLLWPPQL